MLFVTVTLMDNYASFEAKKKKTKQNKQKQKQKSKNKQQQTNKQRQNKIKSVPSLEFWVCEINIFQLSLKNLFGESGFSNFCRNRNGAK